MASNPSINVTIQNLSAAQIVTYFGRIAASSTATYTVGAQLLEAAVSSLETMRLAGTIQWWTDCPLNVRWFGAIGDGVTDDSSAFIAALAAASSGLGTVVIPSATFVIHNVTVPANVTLMGMSRSGSILKLPALAALDGSPILNVTAAGVRIRDLSFNGNKAAQPADGFSDSFNTGANGTGRAYRAAVKAYNAGGAFAELTIENCTFTATYGACVATQNVSKVRIFGCTADSCNFELAYIKSTLGYLAHHHVMNNRITNCGSGDATTNSDGIVLNNATDSVVSSNIIDTVERNGIKLETCQRTQAVNNSIYNVTKDNFSGIQSQAGANDILIAGNRITNAGSGIALNNATLVNVSVVDNVVQTTTGSTLADGVNLGTGSIDGLTIEDNTFRDIKRYGVYIGPSSTATGLVISGNKHKGQAIAGNAGAVLVATGGNWTGVTVAGNLFDVGNVQTNSGVLQLASNDASTMDSVVVMGNTMRSGAGHKCFNESQALIVQGLYEGNLVDGYVVFTSTAGWRMGPTNVVPTTGWVTAANLARTVTASPATVNTDDTTIFTKLTIAGAVAITLPSSPAAYRVYTIKDTKGDAAANNVTVTPSAGTVDGAANIKITTNYGVLRLMWDGTNWFSL